MAACLLEANLSDASRRLSMGKQAGGTCLDNGGMTPRDRRTLANAAAAAGDQQRQVAPEQLGGWWPTGLLAALPSAAEHSEPLQLRECDGPLLSEWILHPTSESVPCAEVEMS